MSEGQLFWITALMFLIAGNTAPWQSMKWICYMEAALSVWYSVSASH